MDNKIFNFDAVVKQLKRLGRIFLLLLLVMLIGALIGCGISSGNPFAIFFPSTWIHLFQFLG